MHRNYQRFLEELMLYERQQFPNAAPYQRHEGRTDQTNGFYTRSLVTRNNRFKVLCMLLQGCWAHKLRNVAAKFKRSQAACLAQARLIYQAANRTEAIQRFRAWKARWGRSAERAVRCLEQDLEELPAHFDCPRAHWKKLRTTNVIERLFVEVRRRIRTMCAFTTSGSCERNLYSVFYRINQHWSKHPLKTFTQNS